jgi:hypothetical protein
MPIQKQGAAVVAFIGLAAVLLGSSHLELPYHYPFTVLGQVHSLRQDAVLMGSQVQQQQHATATLTSLAAASAAATPEALERFQQLHNRPALALRNEAGSYPEIQWPHYSGQQLQPPSEAELQLSSSEPVNGSSPYMLVAYNGSFFGKQWPTHA